MAERKMTIKGFLSKLGSKAAASAAGFLAAHREYLLTGELSEVTRLIVERVDSGDLLPTPAVAELREVVTMHYIALEAAKAEKAIERAGTWRGSKKAFECIIVDAHGRIPLDDKGKELRKTFEKPQEAERWADRRLFDGSPNWHAEVLHNGAPWGEIDRADSIARILRRPVSVATKRRPSRGKLSWGVKVHEKRTTFSHG